MHDESVGSHRLALLLAGLEKYQDLSEAYQDLRRQKAAALEHLDKDGFPDVPPYLSSTAI